MESAAAPRADADVIGAVAEPVEPASPDTRCGTIYDRFIADPDLMAIPVVDGMKPIGLANRHDLLTCFASSYGRALFERKPITVQMDSTPLMVEADLQIDALRAVIMHEKPSALIRGFIITRGGIYAGLGTALSLVRAAMVQTERRNRELQRARAEAEEASHSKSQFLATVSHELRTPLNAIIGFSEIMRTETLGPIGTARYKDYVRDIHGSGLHLLSIINDILDMAKIEAGRMELHEETLDVGDIVGTVVRLVASDAREANLTINLEIASELLWLRADDRAVRQILLNLLSNSVKFTPRGGTVRIAALTTAAGCIELAVEDNGIGIAAQDIPVALAPFGQVANQFTRSHQGTGLGLPLVKALAELHGATFDIVSAAGRGTCVRIVFPAARTIAGAAGQAASAAL